jgi:hypothetical protein
MLGMFGQVRLGKDWHGRFRSGQAVSVGLFGAVYVSFRHDSVWQVRSCLSGRCWFRHGMVWQS